MGSRNKEVDFKFIFHCLPGVSLLLSPDNPDFTIVDATERFLLSAHTERKNIIGKKLFEAFPGNPNDEITTNVINLKYSLEQVIASGMPDIMPIHRYDIENSNGIIEEHYWEPLNTPVIDEQGIIKYIIHTSENVTEKVSKEKKAKTREENFDYYFNHSFAPFAILTGKNFVFTFANAAYIKLMNGRQLVGKPLIEAIPEINGQAFVSLLLNVFETGISFHSTEIAATAVFDGNTEATTRYFNLSYTPYKNPEGVIEGILASGYDITEEVEIKKKEKKQVLNLQAFNLFMQAPVGFSLLRGNDHTLELVNSTGLRMAGKGEEIIGKTISEILPGIESQGYIEILDRVKINGETFNLKESPVTLMINGVEETLYVNLVYQPYYEGENIVGVLSVSTDVTELVLARKESEELRERFETMANNIPNLAWIANADGWIFWYNSRWYEYTGTTPKEMEGWGWKSVHDPENLKAVIEKWQLSIDTGDPFEMVFPLKGADGIFRPFLTRIIPVFDNDRKIIRWLGTNTDITKQKELERMKDDFLSITSHELKTPVTTIKAYGQIAESMLEAKGDLATLGMIKKMGTQVNKLTTLIEELLDISKIHKGKLSYKESFFDFNDMVTDVIEDMQRTSVTHIIKSELAGSKKIFGDKDKLSQVLYNLISNAIKYSPNADSIIVKTELHIEGIQLSVQDFGIGISAQEQQNIFEQFYRVNGDNQSTFPGLGIGLYICSEIIARMGSKIWVESIPGEGSVFFILLPFDHRNKVN